MMAQLRCRFKRRYPELLTSQLYNEQTFYRAFTHDLVCCRIEAFIESPFLTTKRVERLLPVLRKATSRGVKITVNTRHPLEHEDLLRLQAYECIALLQSVGVDALFTGGHHRKLAIVDRSVLWEGSLNILSQNDSCEVMRRVSSRKLAEQMVNFIGIERYLK